VLLAGEHDAEDVVPVLTDSAFIRPPLGRHSNGVNPVKLGPKVTYVIS
jgi:hypothetical protein